MKLKPKIYAEALISGVDGTNTQKVVENFWLMLQKNGQYKDLPKILEAIDEVYAEQNNAVLAKVYSEKELSGAETETIKKKIEDKFKKTAIIKNIIKKNITGIIVKVDDSEIDLSAEGKIEKLKQALTSDK